MQWKGGFDGSNRIPAPSDNLSAFSKLSFVRAACSVWSLKIITFLLLVSQRVFMQPDSL